MKTISIIGENSVALAMFFSNLIGFAQDSLKVTVSNHEEVEADIKVYLDTREVEPPNLSLLSVLREAPGGILLGADVNLPHLEVKKSKRIDKVIADIRKRKRPKVDFLKKMTKKQNVILGCAELNYLGEGLFNSSYELAKKIYESNHNSSR